MGPQDAGKRLDVFLGEHAGSRSAAAKLIDAGLVHVGGRPAARRRTLQAGETVTVVAAPAVAEGTDPPVTFAVAWADEHVAVIDKPAGVLVHPGSGRPRPTLAQALAAQGLAAGGADPDRPGIVHRLDRDTSGLLVVARTDAAHGVLSAAMKAREVEREYLALVEGRPPARSGTIDAPLGRDRRHRTRMSPDTDEPREAVTHFETLEALPRFTLLRVHLETGRTHQIRAHMKAIGHPVAGDPEYGGSNRLGLRRQFLHAARLAFAHPVTGERVEVRCELPADLRDALDGAANP